MSKFAHPKINVVFSDGTSITVRTEIERAAHTAYTITQKRVVAVQPH